MPVHQIPRILAFVIAKIEVITMKMSTTIQQKWKRSLIELLFWLTKLAMIAVKQELKKATRMFVNVILIPSH